MSKKTRAEKREEERRIIAQMQEGLSEQSEGAGTPSESLTDTETKPKKRVFSDVTPETLHCKRCKTLMENGVCPTCGFKVYVPMEKQKRDKIRMITTAVAMVVFVILFLIIQIKKG